MAQRPIRYESASSQQWWLESDALLKKSQVFCFFMTTTWPLPFTCRGPYLHKNGGEITPVTYSCSETYRGHFTAFITIGSGPTLVVTLRMNSGCLTWIPKRSMVIMDGVHQLASPIAQKNMNQLWTFEPAWPMLFKKHVSWFRRTMAAHKSRSKPANTSVLIRYILIYFDSFAPTWSIS